MFLGEIIAKYRSEKGLTMQQFADRADLSKAYISMLEKNQHPQSKRPLVPSIATCAKIAKAMNMQLDELMAVLDDEQSIHIGQVAQSGDDDILTSQETSLLELFRRLNGVGRDNVVEYVRILVDSGLFD